MVLNSLSLDFISVSFASLREGGAVEEIGKRSIWASERQQVAAPTTSYCAIALDSDKAANLAWIQSVISLLSARADVGAVHSAI